MIDGRIAQANGRLKGSGVGVAIERIGNRLYLRATLPPKPGSDKTEATQQRISLSYHANPAGLKLAEQEARKVGALLDFGEFSWAPYLKGQSTPETVQDWIERMEADYFTRRDRTPQSETTWKDDYLRAFKQMEPGVALTVKLMTEVIKSAKPDSKTRRRYTEAMTALAKFAGIEADFSALKGNYSSGKAAPRNLPSDELIAECFAQIPHASWRWAFGAIAAYGLRNHELFHLDFSRMPTLIVLEETKTGERQVDPLYPEWIDEWGLVMPLIPQCTGKNNTELGHRVTKAFKRYQLPMNPYDLRHAWAVRAIRYGLPDAIAAKQMGHSVMVHTRLYQRWISERDERAIIEALQQRSDRPMAPLRSTQVGGG